MKLERSAEPNRSQLIGDEEGSRILESLTGDEPLRSVAIVGSREANNLGLEWAQRVAQRAAEEGIIVVSGGARGIDHQAHISALDAGGETLAILGSGLKQQTQMHRSLSKRGVGLASPFDEHQSARRWTFPKRNLEIAALSAVTVVIQATEESGALITAREALRLNRDVWVLSHLPHERLHRGCLRLIDEGAKPLLTESTWLRGLAAPFKELLNGPARVNHRGCSPKGLLNEIAKRERPAHTSPLWIAACDTPKSLEKLALEASMTYQLALLEATTLELEGWLTPVIGVGYRRSHPEQVS